MQLYLEEIHKPRMRVSALHHVLTQLIAAEMSCLDRTRVSKFLFYFSKYLHGQELEKVQKIRPHFCQESMLKLHSANILLRGKIIPAMIFLPSFP